MFASDSVPQVCVELRVTPDLLSLKQLRLVNSQLDKVAVRQLFWQIGVDVAPGPNMPEGVCKLERLVESSHSQLVRQVFLHYSEKQDDPCYLTSSPISSLPSTVSWRRRSNFGRLKKAIRRLQLESLKRVKLYFRDENEAWNRPYFLAYAMQFTKILLDISLDQLIGLDVFIDAGWKLVNRRVHSGWYSSPIGNCTIYRNALSTRDADLKQLITGATNVQDLQLSLIPRIPFPFQTPRASSFQNMEHLDLYMCYMQASHICKFLEQTLKTLRTLSLRYTLLTIGIWEEVIVFLRTCGNINGLVLYWNGYSDEHPLLFGHGYSGSVRHARSASFRRSKIQESFPEIATFLETSIGGDVHALRDLCIEFGSRISDNEESPLWREKVMRDFCSLEDYYKGKTSLGDSATSQSDTK